MRRRTNIIESNRKCCIYNKDIPEKLKLLFDFHTFLSNDYMVKNLETDPYDNSKIFISYAAV